jgi:hypothetical protein
MTETHYITINGIPQEVEPFIEAENLEISFNFDERTVENNVSNVTFFGKTAFLLLGLRQNPSNIFVNLKYDIELVDGNQSLNISRFIDMKSLLHEKETNYVKVNFIRAIDKNQILELAKNVNFAAFPNYKPVPYVISELPNNQEIALLSFATFYIVFEFQKILSDLLKNQVETASVITAPSGISGTIAQISKLVILTAQGVPMIIRLVRATIQPLKYKKFAYVRDLFDYAAQRLGLVGADTIFHTDPLYRKSVIICKSFINLEDSQGLRGFFNPNNSSQVDYFDKNFDFLMNDLERFFNIERIEVNETSNKLVFQIQNIPTTASFTIDDYSDVGITDNAAELNASYFITFSTDINELNTIDNYEGTSLQVSTRSINPLTINENGLTGLESVTTYFTRAIPKTSLTVPEKIIKTFLDVIQPIFNVLFETLKVLVSIVNSVTKQLNRVLNILGLSFQIPQIVVPPRPNLSDLIENRLGAMLLQNDFLTNEKLTILEENTENTKKTKVVTIDVEDIFNKFHEKELLVNNLRTKKEYRKVIMQLHDFNNITREEALKLSNGDVERVLNINWNKSQNFATLQTESVKNIPITNLVVEKFKPGRI